MAGNKADEKAKTEAPKTAAKAPKVFEEFITGFRSGRTDLIWTPTPKDPVFAIRMSAIDFYEYRVQKAVAAQPAVQAPVEEAAEKAPAKK